MKKALNQIAKWALALLVSVPFVYSCNNKTDSSVPPELEVVTNPMGPGEKSQFLHVQASGDWSITIEYPEDQPEEWVSVIPSTGTGNKSVPLKVKANTSEMARTAVLTLTSASGKAELTLTQSGREIGGGGTGGNTGGNTGEQPGGNLASTTGWLELPAMPKDSKFDFFSHDMTFSGKKIRNYSFAWDYDNLVAPWVAYPLNSAFMVKNVDRTNAWGLDPRLPRNKQPVLSKGYRDGNDGGRARGHQLPSADRVFSYEANSLTFYGTNMTPQIHEGFNSGIWSNLEEKVRSWSRISDTLYVVTGCVTEGSKKYCKDKDGKKVTIPTAYYKAVLRYKKKSTVGHSDYMACAIWLKHEVYSSASVTKQYAMSIDELEKKIGFDLFANLSAKIGEDAAAKVESEDPKTINWWWN